MTLIGGVVSGKQVIIAGDRAALSPEELTSDTLKQPKVFRSGELVLGGSESFRMIQVLQYQLKIPPLTDFALSDGDPMRYMVEEFIPAVRELLTDNGFNETGEEASPPGNIMVGLRGHLYVIQGDYAVMEATDPFDAIGFGKTAFLGAIRAVRIAQPKLAAHHQLALAMEVAESVTFAVKGPFDILAA